VSDLKLFRIDGDSAVELLGATLALGKPLQVLIERNMEVLFGVRFVARSIQPARSTADGSTRSGWMRTGVRPSLITSGPSMRT
jgi:hypothetical protein